MLFRVALFIGAVLGQVNKSEGFYKMKKKYLSVLGLVITLCILLNTITFAANTEYVMQPRWTNIAEIATGLDISLSGKANY